MIEFIIIGFLAGCLTLFLNYCMGKPGSKEFSPYEIFSFYTVWLSKRRLKEVQLYDTYSEQYHDNLKRIEGKAGLISLQNDFKKILYNAADPFFTWERALGMCINCFGFWVSLISGILFYLYKYMKGLIVINFNKFLSLSNATYFANNVISLLIIIVISHITIRILNKIL